ncbi:MAG: hypothetical protein L0H25_00790, partial [Micrococcales bacterium]|nr:hypothetical protein [Micrococcales bacterium]
MIDFAAIAAAYRAGFATQTHGWPTLFDRMEKLLERLTDTSGEAERATRAYPVLRYRDGSVGVRISLGAGALGADALGGAGLADGAGRGLAEGLTAGSRQFVAGFGQVGAMVEQELALPRGMSVLADLAAAVDASLARFEHADASMFDDRARRFSDVFGLAGLGWRALQGPQAQDQLRRAAFRFGHGVEFFRSLSPPGGAAGPAVTDPTERMEALGAAIDEQAQLTLGALLLLPTASEALDVLLGAGVLAAEESILSAVVGIERDVQALRASVVDAWLAAFDIGATLHALASAADLVLSLDSSLLTGALPLWLDALLDGVEVMLDGIRAWGAWTTAMVGAFQVATDDLMGVDLMPWVVRNVLGDFVADHVPLPNVTLDDVIRLATGEGNLALRDDLDDFFGAVDKLLWGVDLVHDVSGLRRKAADLRQIVGLTLSPTPFTYPPDVLPAGPLAGFPDAYAAVFGGSARADLLASVRTLGGQLQRSVHDMGIAGRALAAGLATAEESELDRHKQLGAGI